MLLRCWPEALVAVTWLVGVLLVFRVSAFRADRPDHKSYFGAPYLWNLKYFDARNFTPAGRPLLYWLWFDSVLFAASGVLAIAICT